MYVQIVMNCHGDSRNFLEPFDPGSLTDAEARFKKLIQKGYCAVAPRKFGAPRPFHVSVRHKSGTDDFYSSAARRLIVGLMQVIAILLKPRQVQRVARQRDAELLHLHLNPAQRAQLNDSAWFEVTKADTGRRYVIRNTPALNTQQLDLSGTT